MKIAIIGSRGYPYVYSGYETFVKELAERLVQKGIEVHVYCHKNLFNTFPKQLNGIHLHYVPTIETKSLSQLIHSFFSIIHACFTKTDVLLVVNAANGPLGIIPRITRTKTMINVDGLEWLRPKWKGLGAKYFYFAAKTATKLYDTIITDAEAMRQVYLKEFNTDSTVIAYGAPALAKGGSPLPERFGVTAGEYFLIVGRLIPDNNAELIIKGFLKSNCSKKLLVVGDVPYKDEYAESLKKLASDRLLFPGYVNDQQELMGLYEHAYAYIHGHKFGGTNPTMLKAMANKCAILALDTPFNREMLSDGAHGDFFAETEDAVADTLSNAEQNPAHIAALKQKVTEGLTEKYDWDSITDAYIQEMNKLLDKKQGA